MTVDTQKYVAFEGPVGSNDAFNDMYWFPLKDRVSDPLVGYCVFITV